MKRGGKYLEVEMLYVWERGGWEDGKVRGGGAFEFFLIEIFSIGANILSVGCLKLIVAWRRRRQLYSNKRDFVRAGLLNCLLP